MQLVARPREVELDRKLGNTHSFLVAVNVHALGLEIRKLATLYILKGVKISLDVLNSSSVQYDMLVAEMARL